MEFTADQIVGKTLVAKVPVKILRIPDDEAPAVYTAQPGETIVIVTSYSLPGAGRSAIYWTYEDNKGRQYYTQHKQGRYDVGALQAQGAVTLQQQQAEAAEKNKTLQQRIFASLQNFALLGAAVYLLGTFIKTRKQ